MLNYLRCTWQTLAASLLFVLLFPAVAPAQETIRFTARFADPNGYGDITRATLALGSARCQVEVYPATGELDLLDGPGAVRTAVAKFYSDVELTNEHCSISSADSSFSGNGDQLSISVQVKLPGLLDATRPFAATAVAAGGPVLIPIAKWIDPSPARSLAPPLSVEATKASGDCQYEFPEWSGYFAPGPYSALFLWTTNPGCQGSAVSSVPWLTLGTPGVAGIYNYIPVTVKQNTTGTFNSGSLTFTGTSFSQVFDLNQAVMAYTPNIVSVSPSSGSGSSQVFTIVASNDGLDRAAAFVQFLGPDRSQCSVEMLPSVGGATPSVALRLDSGAWSPMLTLPSLENLQNSMCTVDGALSTASGPGELITFQLAMSFSQAFAGPRYVYAGADGGSGDQAPATYAIWIVPVNPTAPALRITSTHSGNFTQGEKNTYTLTVSDYPGAATSSGTVTVTDTLPQQMTLASMAGTGWDCTGATCTRNDPLAGGNSYPPITVTVNVGDTFQGDTNVATVSGGGSATLSVSDYTFYTPNSAALSISSSHVGNFTQAQTNAAYSIVVSNQAGAEATSGTLTVTDTLPGGLTFISIVGTGWTCSTTTASCSRSDALIAGTSYPAITLTVNVTPTASSPLVNSVSVTYYGAGGGASATDSTVILPHGPAITIQANVTGAPFSLDNGTVYQAPVTFYWTNGEQHTITWLTAAPGQTGATYTFQSWSDGGPNPRTFTATATATYTATIQAEYLLTINIPFSGGSTLTVSPPSSDGYYPAGTSVTLTTSAAPGIVAGPITGDVAGYSPLTITMNAPRTETVNFSCVQDVKGLFSANYIGPGPFSGILYWAANSACTVLAISSADTWFSLGSATVSAGYNIVPYSVSENTADTSRTTQITISGQSQPITLNQYGQSDSFANSVSVSPNSGVGSSEVLTFQVYIPAASNQLSEYLYFTPTWCAVLLSGTPANPTVSLISDTGGYQQLALPGAGTVFNSACAINAATSSVSVSGNMATVQLGVSFTPACAGVTFIEDGNNSTILGLWTVPADPSAPALSVSESYIDYGLSPGQGAGPFWIGVSNAPGAGATSGTVTVTDNIASALSPGILFGTGWSCTGNTCTRSDSLPGGASYPNISFSALIAASAPPTQYDVVTVSGGGSAPFTSADEIDVNTPQLRVQCSHAANFVVGETNATYTIQVGNVSTGVTYGTVTVTDALPPGLSLVSMVGTGWTCTGTTCTTGGPIGGGSGAYPITVTVSVAKTATSPVLNQVTVSGGNSPPNSVSDSTVIVTNPALLTVSLTDNGPFYGGDSAAAYTVVVSNQAGAPATSGAVTVSASTPTGIYIDTLAGSGWSCSVNLDVSSPSTCTRSDALAAGSTYPPITIGVNVIATTGTLAANVSVVGGASATVTASDSTVILPQAVITASLTDSGNFTQGENGAMYTATISAKAGLAPRFGGASFTDYVPAGLTLVSIGGTGWSCSANAFYGSCSRSDTLAAGSSYPPVTITVNIAPDAGSPVVNSITVSGVSPEVTASDSTVVLPHAAAVTIQASVTGVPFSLEDGSTYQAPVTFYWPTGARHTVTWLTAVPGQTNARYTFGSWTDGGGNPRTFAGGTPGTYTADVSVQYQLALSASPPTAGTVIATPSSPDGFYTYGQNVTVTVTPASGFQFTGFNGLNNPYPSLTVVMTSPWAGVANFSCLYTTYGPYASAGGASPAPISALFLWTSGPGCTLTETASADWLTVSAPFVSDGFDAISFSAAENTGAQRDATLDFSVGGQWSGSVVQGAAGSPTPGPVSVTPSHGTGIGQVFALQAYDATGYANIGEIDLTITGMDGSVCHAAMSLSGGQSSLYLVGDADTFLGPMNLPGTGTLQNSRCTLSAAGSSFSGTGKFATANFDLTFTSAFSGSKYVTGMATDTTGTNGQTNVLGTWTVTSQPGAPTLSSPANLAGSVSASPSLNWIANAATSYDVYFGTSATPPYAGTTTAANYSPAALNPGSTYYWQVVAKNSSGSNASAVWSFTTAQSCSAPVTAASPYSIGASGGGATVAVSAADGCSWGYTTPVSWITYQPSGGLGSGSGSLAFTVAASDATTQRNATITVAGVNLTITQAANLTCDVTSDPQPAVTDIQEMINESLGTKPPLHALNGNKTVTVAEVQVVLNAVVVANCAASGN